MVHKPPSRVRYEKSHPTISTRVDLETKEALERTLEIEGMSYAGYLKEKIRKDSRDWKGVYEKGLEVGYYRGQEAARIWYFCAKCGRRMFIKPESEEHHRIIDFLRKEGWAHAECHERRR